MSIRPTPGVTRPELDNLQVITSFVVRASRAIAVVSMCGFRAAPKTMPLPAFHPPPGQARSTSISVPNRIRLATCSVLQQGKDCFSVIREKAVGTTQLTVPGNHGHPYLSGSNRTRAIHCSKFPIPKPMAFAPFIGEQPAQRLFDRRRWRLHEAKRYRAKRSRPASFRIIAFECWPASVSILRAQEGLNRLAASSPSTATQCHQCSSKSFQFLPYGPSPLAQPPPGSARLSISE